jgi:hypothetical protein
MIIQVLIDWCLTPTLAINTNQSINQSINIYMYSLGLVTFIQCIF